MKLNGEYVAASFNVWYYLRCWRQVQRPNTHVGRNLQETWPIKLVCANRDRTGSNRASAIPKCSGPVNKSQLPTGERLRLNKWQYSIYFSDWAPFLQK